MSQPERFENVTALTRANVYFDGKVVSHTLLFPDGSRKTLGLIFPGSYHFGTAAPEKMEIIAGQCRVTLDGTNETVSHAAGSAFRVAKNSGFTIEIAEGIAEYVCSFE